MTYRDWGGYGDFLNEALGETQPDPTACPKCGEPLDQNENGDYNCPRGDWHADAFEIGVLT